MIATVDKIHKKYSDGTSATAGLAFQLLFLQVGLQTFREPEQCAEILEVRDVNLHWVHLVAMYGFRFQLLCILWPSYVLRRNEDIY